MIRSVNILFWEGKGSLNRLKPTQRENLLKLLEKLEGILNSKDSLESTDEDELNDKD